jgi:hypothetical protein
MSQNCSPNIISFLRESLAIKKTRIEKVDNMYRYICTRADLVDPIDEVNTNIFFEQLDTFIKETIPYSLRFGSHEYKRRQNDNYFRQSIMIEGSKFPFFIPFLTEFHPQKYFEHFTEKIVQDPKFKDKREQLIQELQIELLFDRCGEHLYFSAIHTKLM